MTFDTRIMDFTRNAIRRRPCPKCAEDTLFKGSVCMSCGTAIVGGRRKDYTKRGIVRHHFSEGRRTQQINSDKRAYEAAQAAASRAKWESK
jgi:hypothetical protein